MIRLPRRITEKVRPFKWLRMLPNFLRIPANFLRSLRSDCRISCESFANVKNTYVYVTITTNVLPSIRISCDAYETVTKTIRICFPSEFRHGRLTFQPILLENLESPVLRCQPITTAVITDACLNTRWHHGA